MLSSAGDGGLATCESDPLFDGSLRRPRFGHIERQHARGHGDPDDLWPGRADGDQTPSSAQRRVLRHNVPFLLHQSSVSYPRGGVFSMSSRFLA